jgi:hypothetical protein
MDPAAVRVASFLGAAILAAPPGSAQTVKLEELVNTTIKSRTFRAQTVRLDGKEYTGRVQSDVEIAIGRSGDPIRFTQTSTWHGQNGYRRTTVMGGSPRQLGKSKATPYVGGGHSVAMLLDGTFYLIRTYKSGGFKFEFKLAGGSKGLTCSAREVILNEEGAGEVRANSLRANHPIVIVSDTQISSTCRVIQR